MAAAPKTSETSKTGSEVLAYCSACKMDLAAMVVAMDGASIAKVQCKTCKKERAYKPPKGVADPIKAPKKRGKAAAEAPVKKDIEAEWKSVLNQAVNKKARKLKYNIKTPLVIGDIVEHPSFGDGVVIKLFHPNKAEVIFQTDLKVMMHSVGR